MNQFLLIACTLVVAIVTSAGAGAIAPVVAEIDHPRYAYNYAVSDPLTRDNKAQWETRNGDVVKGSYSLVEPDGTLRVVDYHADDLTGFNAVVKKVGPAIHPPGPVAHAPVVAAVGHAVHAPVVAAVGHADHAPIAVAPVVEHIEPVIHAPLLPKAVAPLTSIIGPINYGFGAAPLVDHLPKLTSLGHWSLPWDPYTHSYGGWAPIVAPLLPGPTVTIFSKRVVGNDVHKWVTGPIPLLGNKIILKKH